MMTDQKWGDEAPLGAWVDRIQAVNRANGWGSSGSESVADVIAALALVTTEVAEAIEEVRAGRGVNEQYYAAGSKPEGVPSELADVIIRALDLAGRWGIDIAAVMDEKVTFNERRGFKHGGKRL